MKAVKRLLTVILALGGTAAAVTAAGCSGGPAYSSTATMANWNVATSATVEKNYVDFWRNHKEEAEYEISLKEGGNSTYSVIYNSTDALYKTAFYMDSADYDWAGASIPEEFKITEDTPKDLVYVYETSLTRTGSYQLKSNGNERVDFKDEVTTICKYRLAGEDLKPVYSKHIVKNMSPATLTAVSKDTMCVEVDAVYETYYNRDCTKAIIKTDDHKKSENSGEKSIELSGLTFDNFQLEAALRAFGLSGTKSFSVCSPQNGNSQESTATCYNPVELNTETDGKIISALKGANDNYIFFDGSSSDPETPAKQIRYNAVSLGITADMSGSSPVYWYAALENADANATRCVLLKKSMPLPFGLGTQIFSLKELKLTTVKA